jgi:hypothetical protein
MWGKVPPWKLITVWGWVFVLLVKLGDLKIKNSKNCVGPVLLFLGDLKNRPGSSFKTERGVIMRWGLKLGYVINQV